MTQLFIDGAWVEGEGPQLGSIDPATGNSVWVGRQASKAQVDHAVIAAREAVAQWSAVPLAQRMEHLQRFGTLVAAHRDDLARVISLETGKPTWEALTEVASIAAKVDITIQAYRERTGTIERDLGAFRSVLRHRPHGVLGVLGPYNLPGHLPN